MVTLKLIDKQKLFAKYFAQLIVWVNFQPGYSCTIGEVERPQILQDIYVKTGKSKTGRSYHSTNCAGDLRIFFNGVFQTQTPQYLFAGKYWESLDKDCIWGGRFGDDPNTEEIEGWDGNHFQYGK